MAKKIVLASAISLLVVAFGMPYLEEGREEARVMQAFNQARQIQTGELPADTVDPWGNQFDIRRADDNQIVVVSHGPNGITPAAGYDSDDIATSSSDPPNRIVNRVKQAQILCVLALAVLPWILVVLSAIRRRRRNQAHADIQSAAARLARRLP